MRLAYGQRVKLADGTSGTVISGSKGVTSVLTDAGAIVSAKTASLESSIDRTPSDIELGVARGLWQFAYCRNVFDDQVPPALMMKAGKELGRLYQKANDVHELESLYKAQVTECGPGHLPWQFGVQLARAACGRGGKLAASIKVPTFSITQVDPIEDPDAVPVWKGTLPPRKYNNLRRRRR